MEKFTVDGPAAAANLGFERDRGADRRGRPGRARRSSSPSRAPSTWLRPRTGTTAPTGRRRPPPCCARRAGSPTTTPTRWSGTSSPGRPSTASASRPLGTPELLDGARRRCGRPTRAGDVGHPRAPRCHGREDGQRGRCSPTSRAASPRCGSRSARTSTRSVLLDQVLLDLAPVVLDGRPTAGARALPAGTPTAASCTRRTNLGVSDARRATRDLRRSGDWQLGVRVFVVDATDGPRPRRVRRPGARLRRWPSARTYLRTLTEAGLDLDEAAGLVEFRYAATDEQFPTIAKLRAARRLWAPGPRALRRRASRRAAPARRDQPADDEQVRPLGEHAAHHRRRLRGRCRRRGRRHRAALRQPARRARTRSAAGSPATPRTC